jgi:hypothetical protein
MVTASAGLVIPASLSGHAEPRCRRCLQAGSRIPSSLIFRRSARDGDRERRPRHPGVAERSLGDVARVMTGTKKNLDRVALEQGEHVPRLPRLSCHLCRHHHAPRSFRGTADFPEGGAADFPEPSAPRRRMGRGVVHPASPLVERRREPGDDGRAGGLAPAHPLSGNAARGPCPCNSSRNPLVRSKNMRHLSRIDLDRYCV